MRPIRDYRILWAAAQLAALPLATHPAAAQIHRVPEQHGTIAAAIAAASDGDTVLVAPGTWVEHLEFDGKELTVASHFLLTQDPDFVGSTVIDGGMGERERNARVVFIGPNQRSAITLVGLTIQNADDCISSNGRFELIHSRITRCSDGIDFQSGTSAVVRHSVFEDNDDDGLDLDDDIAVTIEHNLIRNNRGDGVEIRLHPYQGPTLTSVIRGNAILGNREDGIQLIDYPERSDLSYVIEANQILDNGQAGIGCMSDGVSREDYRAHPIPEPIRLTDNVIRGNERTITCGETVLGRNGIRLRTLATGR